MEEVLDICISAQNETYFYLFSCFNFQFLSALFYSVAERDLW